MLNLCAEYYAVYLYVACRYPECLCAEYNNIVSGEWHFAASCVSVQNIVMLSVCAEYHYAESMCRMLLYCAECCYTVCLYAACRHAECHGS
jgi:hypothetical protein